MVVKLYNMGKLGKSKYINFFNLGEKFGNYEIISTNIVIEHEAKIKCKCKCGKINLVSCYTLVKGTSTQCLECGNSMIKSKNPSWKGFGNISGKFFSKLKREAIKRNIIFDISFEYLDELYTKQKHKCNLTGLDIEIKTKNQTASLDRINSAKGYIEGNVQWVHKDINMMKRIYNQDYFISMCKLVSQFN